MIYLLGQILLCLLLAALTGWFIGWSWRGFREQDRVEDLRRTLRATEEVKDRDLAETQRREEALQSRVELLERRAETLADELSAARRGDAGVAGGGPSEERRRRPEPRAQSTGNAADEGTQPAPFSLEMAELRGLRGKLADLEEQLDREQRSRSEAEQALHEKTAALLSLQAELRGLRAGTDERAAEVARLERRVVELEPLEERLRRREEELRETQARLHESTHDRRTDEERARELDGQIAAMEEQLRVRDRRINALRNDYNDVVARLESVEAERERLQEPSRRLQQVEQQLDEARTALQRQLERNRKQEELHQQVVANLHAELRELATVGAPLTSAPAIDTEEARWRQALAQRDSSIAGLRRRIGVLEEQLEGAAQGKDDLQRIPGIDPEIEELLNALGVTRYEQIARWVEDDIDRVSARLGPFAGRIWRHDWIERARRQHLLKYGSEPRA